MVLLALPANYNKHNKHTAHMQETKHGRTIDGSLMKLGFLQIGNPREDGRAKKQTNAQTTKHHAKHWNLQYTQTRTRTNNQPNKQTRRNEETNTRASQ